MRGSSVNGSRPCAAAHSASCCMSVPYAVRVFSAIPRAFRCESNDLSWTPHVDSWAVDVFFIDTQSGQVATRRQLVAAGLADSDERPVAPWFRIKGDSDASTLWYAVMRKQERGVFIGTLCIRHTDWHASLLEKGWEEVPVEEIAAPPAEQ